MQEPEARSDTGLHKKITLIYQTFGDCEALERIDVAEGNDVYASVDGVVFTKDLKTLLFCPPGREGTYAVPAGVTTISESAFRTNSKLTEIALPDSVTQIYGSAFYGCSSLVSVRLPEQVDYINTSFLFFGCEKLEEVTLPEGTDKIGTWAFHSCINLKSIAIPDAVCSIGERAFYQCAALAELSIPDNVTDIGKGAFWGCAGLKSVRIGSGVQRVGASAFLFCPYEDVTFSYNGTWEDWCAIEFGGDNESLHAMVFSIFAPISGTAGEGAAWTLTPDGVLTVTCDGNLTEAIASEYRVVVSSIVVEEGVRSIGTNVFYGFGNAKTVWLPKSLTAIEDYAFFGTQWMRAVYYAGTQEEWNEIHIGRGNEAVCAAYQPNVHEEIPLSNDPMTMVSFINWMLEKSDLTSAQIADLKRAKGILEDAAFESFLHWYGGDDTGFPEERGDKVIVPEDPNDAVRIENIDKSMDVLRRINELRAQDENFAGVLRRNDTAVSFAFMAIAQAGAMRGAALHRHASLSTSCENLSFGSADPAGAWYSEKETFDYLLENAGMEKLATEQDVARIKTLADTQGYTVGHYTNLFWSVDQVAGVAYTPYGWGAIGTFCYNASPKSAASYTYTVAEFEALFDAYCKSIGYERNPVFFHTVTYDANGGHGAPFEQCKSYGSALTLAGYTPWREGYTFLGWATDKNASEAAYQPGDTYSIDADITLYAVWRETEHLWDEGHQAKTPTCTEMGEMIFTCTLCGETKAEAISALGHDWGEWTVTTEATCEAPGVETRSCSRCGAEEERELSIPVYTVTYDANGGTDMPEVQKKLQGSMLTLSEEKPQREACIFLGWAADKNAAAAEYQPGDSFSADTDTVLYAVWYEIEYTPNGAAALMRLGYPAEAADVLRQVVGIG